MPDATVKLTISMKPQVFRELLEPNLQVLFDKLVAVLVETAGVSEGEAETLIAEEMLKAIVKR